MSNKNIIGPFSGEYSFLSNFHHCHVPYNGNFYRNAEAAFQAQKTLDEEVKEEFERLDPLRAKRKGRKLELRSDWESVKVNIMKEVVKSKFMSNPELRNKLIATRDAELIEFNNWRDVFWGVCNGKGENQLGKLLMQVRKEI